MTDTEVVVAPIVRPRPGTAAGTRTRRWSSWVVALVAAVVGAANLLVEADRLPSRYGDDVVWFGAWLSYVAVGAVVLYRRAELPVGPVLVAAGASIQVAGLLDTVSFLDSTGGRSGLAPWIGLAAELAFLPAVLLVAVVLPLLLPLGRLSDRRQLRLMQLGSGAWSVWFLGIAVTPGELDTERLANPVGLGAVPWLGHALELAGGIGLVMTAAACVANLGLRWRRSVDDERRGLAFLAVGAVTQLAVFFAAELLGRLGWDPPSWLGRIATVLLIATLPVAVGLAILRTRLLDIELVLRRTLTYLAMTLVVLAVYVITVLAVGRATSHTDRLSTSLLVTGLAAVGLSPLRERAQRQVDRMLYGRRTDAYGVLRELDSAIATARTAADVLPGVTEVIARSLRLPYVAIDLGDAHDGRPLTRTAWGDPMPIVRELGMEHHGRRVGTLLLAARSRGERFTALDDRLLADVAEHAGSAVAAVALAEDAQQSRERLVRALEDDRRRIRRDLHDHLGPVLSGITLQVDALRRMSADDESRQLAETIRGEVADAVVDIRRLVHGLRPPVLDELGLADAVRHHADLVSGEIEVTVLADDLPPLPAAVEVAAYRIITEALTNTLRHAGATSAEVRLGFSGERLHLEVHDDGSGMAEGAERGVGLTSMSERVAELGGQLSLRSSASGTTVLVDLPT